MFQCVINAFGQMEMVELPAPPIASIHRPQTVPRAAPWAVRIGITTGPILARLVPRAVQNRRDCGEPTIAEILLQLCNISAAVVVLQHA
jgi:hypothetical protein